MGTRINYKNGDIIGKLIFVRGETSRKFKSGIKRAAVFRCQCGVEFTALINGAKTLNTKSCGCHNITTHKLKFTTHGKCGTKIYRTWVNMRNRCGNSNVDCYKYYGGRGIKVCEEWDKSFTKFYQDMGDPPTKAHTIDRIDVNGNYELSNCRWATRKEQSQNKRKRSIVDK